MSAKMLGVVEVGFTVLLVVLVVVGLSGALVTLFADPETVWSGVGLALIVGAFLTLLAIPVLRGRRAARRASR